MPYRRRYGRYSWGRPYTGYYGRYNIPPALLGLGITPTPGGSGVFGSRQWTARPMRGGSYRAVLHGLGEAGAGLTPGELRFGAIVTLLGIVGAIGLVKGLSHWDTVIRTQSARRRAKMRASATA